MNKILGPPSMPDIWDTHLYSLVIFGYHCFCCCPNYVSLCMLDESKPHIIYCICIILYHIKSYMPISLHFVPYRIWFRYTILCCYYIVRLDYHAQIYPPPSVSLIIPLFYYIRYSSFPSNSFLCQLLSPYFAPSSVHYTHLRQHSVALPPTLSTQPGTAIACHAHTRRDSSPPRPRTVTDLAYASARRLGQQTSPTLAVTPFMPCLCHVADPPRRVADVASTVHDPPTVGSWSHLRPPLPPCGSLYISPILTFYARLSFFYMGHLPFQPPFDSRPTTRDPRARRDTTSDLPSFLLAWPDDSRDHPCSVLVQYAPVYDPLPPFPALSPTTND